MRFQSAGLLLLLGGCVSHTFAPGPGMARADFASEAAQCRLFARGAQPGFAFATAGSPRFVAASTAGAALGYAIGSAIQRNRDFNDCMVARGWQIVDGQPVTSDPAMHAGLVGDPKMR